MTSTAQPPALHYDDATHIYTLDGAVLPHVTEILEAAGFVDYSQVPESVLDAAKWRGSATHDACWFDDEGDLDESTLAEEVRPRLAAWRKVRDLFIFRAREKPVYHRVYRYACTPDRVGNEAAWLNNLAVVEIKTCAHQPAAAIQLAAQAMCLPNGAAYHRFAARLKPDGSYDLKEYPLRDLRRDFDCFLAALSCWRWRKENL